MTERWPSPDPCERFETLVGRVLDSELPASALRADPHAADCPACRTTAAAVGRMLGGLAAVSFAAVPTGFADRTTAAAVRDYRRRQRVRWAARSGGLAVAASVLLVAWTHFSRPQTDHRPPVVHHGLPQPAVPPVPVGRSLSEAGSALVSLTKKAADDTLGPALNLFAAGDRPDRGRESPPDVQPLADVPEAARAGLEPVANTAKRALNLFLRDVGGAAGGGKMKS